MNLETIDKQGTMQGYVLVKSCEKKTAKTGSTYLDLIISDGETDVVAKIWDFKGTQETMPAASSIILVRGTLSLYNNQPQFKIDRFRPINEKDQVDMRSFVPSASFTGEQMFRELVYVVNGFQDEDLKKLALTVLDEYKARIMDLPAAFKLHHAVRSGLLMHTLSICRLAQTVISLYPSVDGDLLLCGAILHDIAKSEEFNIAPTGLVESYTVRGTLVGHLVRGAMIVEEIGKRLGIAEDKLVLVEHMLISHHGIPEFGAAVRPLFLEAEILSALDTLDANIYEIENVVKSVEPGSFTNKIWALDDRKFYNHGRKEIHTDIDTDFKCNKENQD